MRILRLLPVLCLLLLSGCTEETPQGSTPSTPVSVKKQLFPRDDLGREINLKAPAQRVVCIGPGATETIFALGAGSKLVGRDQVSDYPQEARKVAVAGDYNGPFIEKVIALRPDLVIVQGETYDKARAENWQQKIGVPVAILVPTSVDKVANGITKIGVWLNASEESRKLTSAFKPYLFDKGLEGEPKGFFEVQRSPLWTAGKGTLIYSIMGKAEIANLAFGVSGYKQYNRETLLAKDPDLYIVAVAQPEKKRVLRELRSDKFLGKLRCVREGKIIAVSSDWVLRPGPRLLKGIEVLKREAASIQPKSQP